MAGTINGTARGGRSRLRWAAEPTDLMGGDVPHQLIHSVGLVLLQHEHGHKHKQRVLRQQARVCLRLLQ